ncbi:MAG TPA: type II secretion system protein GspC [bacterium]|nr:type II secretion system protein GspC [bacterium]
MYYLRRYDWILHVATIVLCAYLIARGLSFYFSSLLETAAVVAVSARRRPAASVAAMNQAGASEDARDYGIIAERNMFNSKDVKVAAKPDQNEPDASGALGPAVKTSLDLRIGSIMLVGDGTDRRSSAIIAVGKARGQTYFVDGDEGFAPNVKLKKVEKGRIEFINGGRLEYAELQDTSKTIFAPPEEVFGKISLASDPKIKPKEGGSSSSSGTIFVDQKDVDSALQNLDKLQREVNIAPSFQAGKINGFRVLAIRPGGLVSKLGVKRGDVLQKVNGQELDIARGLELFNNLRDSKNFTLDVLRGGQVQTLEYEIR